MKRGAVLGAVMLMVGWAVQSANAWIYVQEVDQPNASDDAYRITVDGGERIMRINEFVGGYDAATNAFPNPKRVIMWPGSPGTPTLLDTFVQYQSITGATLPTSTAKVAFGASGYGPGPIVKNREWSVPTVGLVPVPALMASFVRTGGASVDITLGNASPNAVTYSNLRYAIVGGCATGEVPFSVATLNSAGTASVAWVALGAGGSLAPGASVTSTISGVMLTDDVIVSWDSTGVGAANATDFVAMDAGAPDSLAGPWFGRANIGFHPDQNNTNISVDDLHASSPLKHVRVAAGGTPARFAPVERSAVPIFAGKNPRELSINTTGPGGVKRSYLSTGGCDLYTDVCVNAQVGPGRSTTHSFSDSDAGPGVALVPTPAVADDLGGPVAVRIQAGGNGSYYASVSTGRPNQVAILVEDGTGASTSLASATTWADSSPISIDYQLIVDGVDLFLGKVYDVRLCAVGNQLCLTVTELAEGPDPITGARSYTPVAGHTVTLTATDDAWANGYVGVRSEADSGASQTVVAVNDDDAEFFDPAIKSFVIEAGDCAPTPAPKKVLIVGSLDQGQRADNPCCGFSVNDERAGMSLSTHAEAEAVRELGFDVDEVVCDQFKALAQADLPGLSAMYDFVYVSGNCASSTSRGFLASMTTAVMYSEHVASWHQWDGLNADNATGDLRGPTPGTPGWQGLQNLRVHSATDLSAGNPTHPIVNGFPVDGDIGSATEGTNEVVFYDEPQWHTQFVESGLPNVTDLATLVDPVTGLASAPNTFDPQQRARMGLVAADAGDARFGGGVPFQARHIFITTGDACGHRMSPCGKALFQRAVLWGVGLDPSVIPAPNCTPAPATPVTRGRPTIPAVSAWGMIAMGMLFVTACAILARRRRLATA